MDNLTITTDELTSLARTRYELKARIEAATAELAQLDELMITTMAEHGISTVSDVTGKVTLTVTTQTRSSVDEELVEANVSQRLWHKITRRRLDMSLWKQAVGLGVVKPAVVETVTKVTETKPYFVQTVK